MSDIEELIKIFDEVGQQAINAIIEQKLLYELLLDKENKMELQGDNNVINSGLSLQVGDRVRHKEKGWVGTVTDTNYQEYYTMITYDDQPLLAKEWLIATDHCYSFIEKIDPEIRVYTGTSGTQYWTDGVTAGVVIDELIKQSHFPTSFEGGRAYGESILHNLTPFSCDHQWEKKYLFSSHYEKCSKCGEEK